MLVRMLTHFTGSRDGIEWGPAGSIVELPDHEAEGYISQGYAEEVTRAEAEAQAARDGDEGTTEDSDPGPGEDGHPSTTSDSDALKPTAKRTAKRRPRKAS